MSSKGQVVLPKAVRQALGLKEGTEFSVTTSGDAVVLRRAIPFPPTRLEDVVGIARYTGPRRTLRAMDDAISRAVLDANADLVRRPRSTRKAGPR